MTDTALDDSLTAKDVADYLRRHPGFLNEFPELAAQLELPREQGQVASLAAYQTQNLREKNAELERRLAELAAIAAENERLMLRIHELNVAVLRANTAAVAARSVIARLAEDFQTDQVRLLVFDLELPPADWLVRAPGGQASLRNSPNSSLTTSPLPAACRPSACIACSATRRRRSNPPR